jgi:hypothetical protein
MCFSPVASFGASVVLSGIGIVAMAKARTVPEKFLSGIPVLFAIQQCLEGTLWLALSNPDWAQWQWPTTFGFLLFAQVVWPIYMPIAMLLFEDDPLRKRILTFCTISGFALGTYLVFCLLHYPISASANEHHIRYDLGFALARKWYYGLLYFVPTIVSSLFSSTRRLRWLGYLFLASYIAARLLFQHFVVSVWCFFGAIISIVVLVIVLKLREEKRGSAVAI